MKLTVKSVAVPALVYGGVLCLTVELMCRFGLLNCLKNDQVPIRDMIVPFLFMFAIAVVVGAFVSFASALFIQALNTSSTGSAWLSIPPLTALIGSLPALLYELPVAPLLVAGFVQGLALMAQRAR